MFAREQGHLHVPRQTEVGITSYVGCIVSREFKNNTNIDQKLLRIF
jgi:hypothetical protein